MKLILSLLLVMLSGKIDAQTNSSDSIYTDVDIPAEFPGGRSEMLKLLRDSLKFPETMGSELYYLRFYVRFVVEKDGSISDAAMIRAIEDCPPCNAEIIRCIKSMPKWIPGKLNRKAVRSYFDLPVSVHLN